MKTSLLFAVAFSICGSLALAAGDQATTVRTIPMDGDAGKKLLRVAIDGAEAKTLYKFLKVQAEETDRTGTQLEKRGGAIACFESGTDEGTVEYSCIVDVSKMGTENI